MKYDYECPGDGQVITIERSINDSEIPYFCRTCGAQLARVFTPPAISFKGPGFYKTDR